MDTRLKESLLVSADLAEELGDTNTANLLKNIAKSEKDLKYRSQRILELAIARIALDVQNIQALKIGTLCTAIQEENRIKKMYLLENNSIEIILENETHSVIIPEDKVFRYWFEREPGEE
jgi:rubrerythrin